MFAENAYAECDFAGAARVHNVVDALERALRVEASGLHVAKQGAEGARPAVRHVPARERAAAGSGGGHRPRSHHSAQVETRSAGHPGHRAAQHQRKGAAAQALPQLDLAPPRQLRRTHLRVQGQPGLVQPTLGLGLGRRRRRHWRQAAVPA